MSEKLIAFFIAVKYSKRIIDVLLLHPRFAHSLEKFGFVITNKDISKYWTKKGTHNHTIKLFCYFVIPSVSNLSIFTQLTTFRKCGK